MQTIYESFEILVPAGAELVVETITGRPGALPYITSVWREPIVDIDTLFFVNDSLFVDIPNIADMGFGGFLPFYFKMKDGDIAKAGFRNRSTTPNTLRFTIQYHYLE